ncbi:MAG: glucose-1-phosphate adenylyltransferase [Ruminococcaceae bacterium]|nr:glucose-1-phosphate adenylyltransferase [Oscillospiraceae bacterium]
MFRKKECVAMLLAGGQGSRLYALTEKTAKPAVIFGGKYRIIDFTLSNCINSGIDTVGVLTQYQPLVLGEHIGNGLPWDLDRAWGGVKLLPPYQGKNGADWYRGTANAIYQNMEFIDRYDPEYVLILSGDHIYKMDYAAMLEYHKQTGADATIAVINVPLSEASRFGIMSADENGRIYKFAEKPKEPEGTLASMGIYIFTKKKLFEYLISDEENKESSNDFGKNIIPTMLASGEKLCAYPFEGYWKDVGTISSLWEANMDLLGEEPVLKLSDEDWRIYSRHEPYAPQYIGEDAVIENSSVTEGCEIEGTLKNSVIGPGVKIAKGAVVEDSVIFDNVTIGEGSTISCSIIDSGVQIGKKVSVGAAKDNAKGVAVVGAGVVVGDGEVIADNEMIYSGKEK